MGAESENIGQVNVSIGADYSPLVAAVQSGESIAAAGGKAIGDALVAGAAAAGNIGANLAGQFNILDLAAKASIDTQDAWAAAIERGVAAGMTMAEAAAAIGSAMAAAEAPTQQEAEQLTLFANAIEGIPWAEATGQLNLFTDEIEPLTAGANSANIAIKQVGEALGSVPAAAGSVGPTLAEIAQQLVAIGAALIIVNKIEAFGAAALEASDNITKASISLTVLTGSAETAAKDIQKLEDLGIQEGLSMPALLTAAVRMQALLGAAAPVPELLAQLGNAAAVSGQGIESAANAFDRIATSGTVAARQLVPLGVNLSDLASAFNKLSGTSIATEDNIRSLFKSLDEAQRIDVLTQALTKLNGIGAQVAKETFGGQWTALIAQWTQVLNEAGRALIPVITDLLDFTKTDIIPFLKMAIEAFNALPTPIKDISVGLGLATLASISLAAGLGTLGIALGGVSKLLQTIGLTGGEAAIGEEAAAQGARDLAVAEGAVAIEGNAAAASLATLGAGAGTAGLSFGAMLPFIGAIVLELGYLAKAWVEMKTAEDGARAATDEAGQKAVDLSFKLQGLGVATSSLDLQYAAGTINLRQYVEGLDKLAVEYSNVNGAAREHKAALDLSANAIKQIVQASNEQDQAYKTAKSTYDQVLASIKNGTPIYKDHVATQADLVKALDALNAAAAKLPAPIDAVAIALAMEAEGAQKAHQAHSTALGVFHSVLDAYNAGKATYAQLTAAQDALTKSEIAAAAAGIPIAGTLSGIELAAKSVTSSITALASSHDIAAAKTLAHSDSLRTLAQDVAVGSQKLALLATAQADAQRAADGHKGSEDQLRAIMVAMVQAAADLQAKQDALALATIRAQNAAAGQQGAVGLATQTVREASLAASEATRSYDAGTISAGAYTGAHKALRLALEELHSTEADEAANVSRSTEAWAAADVELAIAKSRLGDITAAYRDHLATMKEVVSAKKSELDAQIAADEQNARSATGTVGLTDKISIYTRELAAAKAKLADLTAASHDGSVQDSVLSAAQDAVTTATRKLQAAQADCQPAIRGVTDGLSAEEKQAINTGHALDIVTDAAVKATGAMGALSKAAGDALMAAADTSSLFGATPTITLNASQRYYNAADVPHSGNAQYEQMLGRQYQVNPLVPEGKTMDQTEINSVMQQLQDLIKSAGLTGTSAALKLQEAVGDYARTASLPTLAQLGLAATATPAGSSFPGAPSVGAGGTPADASLQNLMTAVNDANRALTQITFQYQQGTASLKDLQDAQANAALWQAQLNAANGVGHGSPVSSAAAATSGTLDNAAAGGAYPGVVIHQAAGEILYVAIASGSTNGGGSPLAGGNTVDQTNSTAALAASATAATVSQAASTMSNVIGAMQDLSVQVAAIAASTVVSGTNVVGGQIQSGMPRGFTGTWTDGRRYENGSLANGVINGTTYVNGIAQNGNAANNSNSMGATTVGNVGQQGHAFLPTAQEFQQQLLAQQAQGAYLPTAVNVGIPSAPAPSTAAPNATPAIAVTIDQSGSTFGGDKATMHELVAAAVVDGISRVYRDNGARI